MALVVNGGFGESRGPRKERVSETAIVTAQGRAFTDIPNSREIRDLVFVLRRGVEDLERQQAIKNIGRGMASQIEARYRLINKQLARTGVTQVLEVAAGLSPRGLNLTQQDDSLRYVELDLPGVMGVKREIVKRLVGPGNRPRGLHLEAGDALLMEDLKSAIGRIFDPNKPIAVIHEGMLRYFSFPEKITFANHVRDLLYYFRGPTPETGAWITCDVTLRTVMKTEDALNYGQNTLLSTMVGMDIYANAFNNLPEAVKFFESLGFSVEVHPYTEVKKQLVSPQRAGISKKKAEEMIKDGVVVLMKPARR